MKKRLGLRAGISSDDVAVTNEVVFVYQQAFHAYRPTGVRLIRADADFGAESVSETVGKTSGSVIDTPSARETGPHSDKPRTDPVRIRTPLSQLGGGFHP